MDLWEVFKKLLEQKDAKISDVASATGLPYTTVDSIIKKQLKDIKFSSAKKIADYFGVEVGYLYNGESRPSGAIPYDPSYFIALPVYGRIAAGVPITANQEYGEYYPLDKRFVNLNGYSIEDFFWLLVEGDSMEPGIMDGDLVLVRRQSFVESNKIGIVICNGEEATVKRITALEDKIILHSDNKNYSPQIYPAKDCQIIGKVLQRTGRIR